MTSSSRAALEDLHALAAKLAQVKIAIAGDVMLDRFVYGSVSRISPEAPVPIFAVQRETAMPGGAGNVVRNAASLGAPPAFLTVYGADPAAHDLSSMLAQQTDGPPSIVAVNRRTTVKTRYVAASQQLLRADADETARLDRDGEDRLIAAIPQALKDASALAISDYAKGVLTPRVLRALIAAAKTAGIPCVADPKSPDFSLYDGVGVLTPNARELADATRMPTDTGAAAAAACQAILERSQIGAILVTRSEHGATLVRRGAEPVHIPVQSREVYDVSGAGDTVLAVLALALGAGGTLEQSAILANLAGGIVVGKSGTAVVRTEELHAALGAQGPNPSAAKLRTLDSLGDDVRGWRARGLRVGFTNGCFDILHAGHVSLLKQARAACDRLIVALNSDASVRRLKGPSRPVNGEASRAAVISALEAADRVIFFDGDTPIELIEGLRPEVLIKGADYSEDQVVGGAFVKSYGGRIALIPLTPDHSTTGIIRKVSGAGGAT